MQNREIRLARRPIGLPTAADFQFVDTNAPQPTDGEVLVRMQYISVDPYLRGRMREGKSYIPPFDVGQVIESAGVGEVLESRAPAVKPGDIVSGQFGWRLFNVVKGEKLMKVIPGVPPSAALGVLGIPGLTAYFALLDIRHPKAGQTLLAPAPAGAV